jgi:hypothetical protein
MTFARAQDETYESFEGIHFLMWDPNSREQIPCLITREALTDWGAAHVPPLVHDGKIVRGDGKPHDDFRMSCSQRAPHIPPNVRSLTVRRID